MAGRIRVLDAANRTMQRLGYLKPLCALVNETETSNLETLGKRFIARVTQRVKMSPPFPAHLQDYAKTRLTDGAYLNLRKTILENAGPAGVELQDLYLADRSLASNTGKLVEANWRRYPYLGTSLDLVKKGTYSSLTRSLVLLAVTPREELDAFGELDESHNPLRINDAQGAVLLYCLLDNDAEVLGPLLQKYLDFGQEAFDEREAGNLLPTILRETIRLHQRHSVTAEERDRLVRLEKTAASIDKWKHKSYSGGGARQETITVRLEPLCDLGLLSKPERERFAYRCRPSLQILAGELGAAANIDAFLSDRFFACYAKCHDIDAGPAHEDEATNALVEAGATLKSSLGYSPITDVALLAGARLLTEQNRILEPSRAVELLKSLQKQDPEFVRFTVDRMGVMAYVKFAKTALGAKS